MGLSVEAMMLDSKASDLDKEERPEVYFDLTHLKSFQLCYIQMNLYAFLGMDQKEKRHLLFTLSSHSLYAVS